jgi:agmatine deiminase
MRDVGPTCVVDGRGAVRGVDWRFNAWGGLRGGLYFPWDQDDLVARKVLEIERLDRYRAPIVNEGGAIHSDGEGTLLVTEQCILNRNRNPQVTGAQIESLLKAYTGATEVVWLGDGVFNDETDGHVDNLACFVAPGVVALLWTDDERDPQHEACLDAWTRLHDARDAKGRRFKVHKIPMPGPLYMSRAEAAGLQTRAGAKPRHARERLAASYVNFYIANGGIVMPLLDPRTDAAAAAKLRRLFPGRKVVGVPAREILLGGGNIHCITQQIPLGARRRGS